MFKRIVRAASLCMVFLTVAALLIGIAAIATPGTFLSILFGTRWVYGTIAVIVFLLGLFAPYREYDDD